MSTQEQTGADLDRAQQRVREEHKRQERTNGDAKKERRDPTPYTVLEKIGTDDLEDVQAMLEAGELFVRRGVYQGRKDTDAIKLATANQDVEGRTFVAVPRFTERKPERKVVERLGWS